MKKVYRVVSYGPDGEFLVWDSGFVWNAGRRTKADAEERAARLAERLGPLYDVQVQEVGR